MTGAHVPNHANPALAGLLSVLIPGAGQIYVGRRSRGALIFVTMALLLALVAWFELWSLLILALPFWGWQAWEARLLASAVDPGITRLVLSAALLTYAIGWQVTEISVDRLLGNAPKIVPFVGGLFQPSYLDRTIEYAGASLRIEVPCGEGVAPPDGTEGSRLLASTLCADPGEEIVIQGIDFPTGAEGELWWENTIGDRSRLRRDGEAIGFEPDAQGRFERTILVPNVTNRDPRIQQIEARYITSVGSLELSETSRLILARMGETVAQALMATTLGAFFALFLSFFAARNLMQTNLVTLALYYLMRALLNILRAIEPLIMAIVFVIWVGLGPFAGVLALTVHSIAALGKLYSESIESIETGPIEAITATGAGRAQVIWYGVLPQVWPPFIAFTLYRWDINVRMSTIIGFVGGGGIGFLLQQWIRLTDFQAAGAAIWAIAVVVTLLDLLSSEVRKRVI